MAILTSEHLFAQAEELLEIFPGRKPRQTEIRRSISASYYGLFHFILKEAADEYVGAIYGTRSPPDPRYIMAYRSVTHTWLRSLCVEVAKPNPPAGLVNYLPKGGFGQNLRKFALNLASLQEKRHAADYDLTGSYVRGDALTELRKAREAVISFQAVTPAEHSTFLALLLFRSRGRD